jgi:ubiquinone/menaquinone biosynthesis C-methylase UbiE
VNTIYFWNNYEKSFSEIKRVLKDNGLFINTIYTEKHLDKLLVTKGFNKFTAEQLREITDKNGFSKVQIIEIEKDKSLCIVAKK